MNITWLSLVTVVMFSAFILMALVLYIPRRDRERPYKDAEKLALKEGDEIITPRHSQKHHER